MNLKCGKLCKFVCWTLAPALLCGVLVGCQSWSQDHLWVYSAIVPALFYGCITIVTLAPLFFRYYLILTLELNAFHFFGMMILLCLCAGWLDLVFQETS